VSVSLRAIERGDADQIAAVHLNAWLVGYRGIFADEYLDSITFEDAAATWAGWLSAEDLPPVTVALRDGVLVGFCRVATPSRDADADDRWAEVAVLNVSPDAWRSGVGTALMHDALERFQRDGWAVVTLWVAEENERAQAFYRRLGFELDGARAVHEGSGAPTVRMRLDLA
jgi:ribosomal protein S18 acetylase RimI-like enzyme